MVVNILLAPMLAANATPFESCPTEAFLVQDQVAKIYGVNLATGSYEELSTNMGTSGKINAIGYSFHDDYIYGFGYEFNSLVKIGSDFVANPLVVTGLPNSSFYIGDVSIDENSYYAYRRGEGFGLYKVDLSESSPNFLSAERVIDGASVDLRIFDFAFHPDNGLIYSVDSSGNLVSLDPAVGEVTVLSNVGESGTFGAVYFDVGGNLYISRNSDGHIFRVNTMEASPTAEFFAFGPLSGNNDGARCGLAPIIAEDSAIDFGDAPDSYGTTIESNGARHDVSVDLYLGERLGEDDGINFVTGFETGLDTLINVVAAGEGYLNMWVDWNQDGTFEDSEQVVVDKFIGNGVNPILLAVPANAETGETWSRARFSTMQGLKATGGVIDGEVEDQSLTVTPSGVSIVSYPGSNAFVSLSFEDNWPEYGDYDLNDVVMAYRTRRYLDENQRVVRYDMEGRILAVGADFHNGFAVQLDDVRTDNIADNLIRFEINGNEVNRSALEANQGQDDAVIVIFEDLWSHLSSSENCGFYRTQSGCEQTQDLTFSVSVPLIASLDQASSPQATLNPFIFATPGRYHGNAFATQPGRSLEIHLKNKKVSARFNQDLFGTYDDNSDISSGTSFLSGNNMPWAIEIPILWSHPKERVDIINAYPEFSSFVETGGSKNATWYVRSRAVDNKIINN